MKQFFLIALSICLLNGVFAQSIMINYVNLPGISVDTIRIYFTNLTPDTLNIGSVNLSIVHQSTCTAFLNSASIFRDEWGSTFEYSQSNNVNNTYESIFYDQRYQYANTSSDFFNPTTVPLPDSVDPQFVMDVVFSSSCPSYKRMEDLIEWGGNEITDENNFNIPYIIGNNAVGLPVEWLSFEAYQVGSQEIKLDWQTASEINNHKFVIEKSANATDFYSIGEVEGVGESVQVSSYSFLDHSPMHSTNYYRIKQIDLDGTFSFSDVRQVELSDIQFNQMTIYPNPVKDRLNVRTSIKDDRLYDIQVIDLSGRVLHKSQSILGSKEYQVKLNSLSPGIYFIELIDTIDGMGSVRKFIKK